MKSRSWRRRFLLACAIISLLAGSAVASTPALVVVATEDVRRWQSLAQDAGWRLLVAEPAANRDARVQALAAAVEKAVRGGADPERIYFAGSGPGTAALFYT